MKFKSQVIVLAATAALPLLALVAYFVAATYARDREIAFETMARVADAAAAEMERLVSGTEAALAALAARTGGRPSDPAACDAGRSLLLEPDSRHVDFLVVGPAGRVICTAAAADEARDVADAEWFARVMATNRLVAGKPGVDWRVGREVVVFAYPLRSADGAPVGAVAMTHALAQLRPVSELTSVLPTAAVMVVDRDGTVIVRRPETDWSGLDASEYPIVRKVLAGDSGPAIGVDVFGEDIVFAARPVPKAGWTAVAVVSTEVVFAPARANAIRAAVIVIAVLILLTVLTVALVRCMVRPIAAISGTARAVTIGDMDARVPAPEQGEFAELARQFNAMLDVRQRSERRLTDLLENMPDGIVLVDSDHAVHYANGRIERQFGYARSELHGNAIELLIPDLSRARHPSLSAADRRAPALREMGRDGEIMARRKDGSEFPVEITMSPVTMFDAEMTCCTVRDVTEKQQADRRIRKLARMYAALGQTNRAIINRTERRPLLDAVCRIAVEQGDLGLAWIGIVDPATGAVRHEASFGPVAELVDRLCISTDPAKPLGRGPTARAIRDGRPIIMDIDYEIADEQRVPKHMAALIRDLRSVSSFPLRDGGTVVGAITFHSTEPGYFDDPEIGELLAELAGDLSFALAGLRRDADLAESEARFRQITESLRDVVWLVDPAADKVLYVSPAYERIWGVPAAEVYAARRSWIERVHPDDRDRLRGVLESPETTGGYDEEFRIVWPDGSIRWLHARAFPVRGASGSVHRVAGVTEDITERRSAEAALRQEAERLDMALKAGNVGLWELDLTSYEAYHSPEWKAQLGYRDDEVSISLGQWQSRLHPDDFAGVEDALRRYLDDPREAYAIVYRQRHRDGSYRWFRAQGKAVRDARGAPLRMVGARVDITEAKAIEGSLRRSEANLALAQEIAEMGSFEIELSTGANTWSAEMRRLFGLPPGAAAPSFEAFLELLHPGDRLAQLDTRETILRTGEGATVEYRSNPARGPVRHFRATVMPVKDAEGRVIATTGAVLDVTESKAIEESLRRSEASLAAAQRLAGLGSWQLDIKLRRGTWSEEMYRLFGRDPALGWPSFEEFLELIDPADRAMIAETVPHIERTGERVTHEFRSNPERGPVRSYSAVIAPVTNETGTLVGLHGAVIDVTRIKETEERVFQLQKMESLGTLAGGIAHDFNNMLVPIKALAELTRDKLPADSPLQENLDAIVEAAGRAADLVKQIMAFSRHDEEQIGALDISDCVAEAIGLVRKVLPATITVVDEVAPQVGSVQGDAAKLHSVILNLATNAAHAIEGRVGRLIFGLSRVTADAERHRHLAQGRTLARITIRDTGHGMDEATLKRIFDPFFTTKPVGEGTGLGLAMVHGIVEAMGGAIEVASTVGVGTTFDIYLPLPDSETST